MATYDEALEKFEHLKNAYPNFRSKDAQKTIDLYMGYMQRYQVDALGYAIDEYIKSGNKFFPGVSELIQLAGAWTPPPPPQIINTHVLMGRLIELKNAALGGEFEADQWLDLEKSFRSIGFITSAERVKSTMLEYAPPGVLPEAEGRKFYENTNCL